MAKFRHIYTSFWGDPKVLEEFTPEDKLFYLYLLTNEHTNQIGIYQITKKQIAFEIGYSTESINALLQRFIDHHKIIEYDTENRELFIKNWAKYNLIKGGKPVLDCIRKDLESVKTLEFIQQSIELVEKSEIRNLFIKNYESLTNRETSSVTTSGQKEKEKEKKDILSGKPDFESIVLYLNNVAGTNYRYTTRKTQQLIKARLNEGFTEEDFKTVIDKKAIEWLNDPNFAKYLRPETLFGTKFESYLNETATGLKQPMHINNASTKYVAGPLNLDFSAGEGIG